MVYSLLELVHNGIFVQSFIADLVHSILQKYIS